MLNNRQNKILHYLISHDHEMTTLKKIAACVSCSERTVRNDLNDIIDQLEENKMTYHLEKKPGVGINLTLSSKDKVKCLKTRKVESFQFSSEIERQSLVLITLLMTQKYLVLDELASRFFVSKKIIRDDIEKINQVITKLKGVKIETVPRKGTILIADERTRRELLAKEMRRIQHTQLSSKKELNEFFSEDLIESVNDSLGLLSEKTKINIKDNPLSSITIHILFMIERIKSKQSLTLSEGEWHLIRHSKALDYSYDIAKDLASKIGISFTDDEIGYLALRVSSFNINYEENQTKYYREMSRKTDKIITNLENDIQRLLNIDLSKDNILKNNLKQHLESTFTRINSGFHISNPLKQQIYSAYTQLYLIIQMIIDDVMKQEDEFIPEEEIAYLTVHIQGAIERQTKPLREGYNAVIICDFGKGISAFLEAKIKSKFPMINIVSLLTEADVNQSDGVGLGNSDFIISTMPISLKGIPIIEVSPLFDNKDILIVEDFLSKFKKKKPVFEFDIISLSQPFLVETQVRSKNKEDILSSMVRRLIDKGYVKETYEDSLFQREATSSTRIGHFIALPHGHPTGVLRSSISFVTLEEPIEWGDGPVQLVILLAMKKSELGNKEINQFFSVLNFINENPDLLDKILLEENKLKLLEYFKYYS